MLASHPLGRGLLGLCLVGFAAGPLPAATKTDLTPEGVCGSPQVMLQASQAGSVMIQQVMARGTPWGDKSLNEYINRLGQNLARSSGSQQAFSFYVLYNPAVNAEALPGGYIVVNTGVISLAESEAELAAVLSHEIAHENSCDWRAVPWKANLFEIIALVPAVVLGGPAGMAIASGTGYAANVARARNGRSIEERADRLAAEYLARAGYDPYAAAQFFERLQAQEERTGIKSGGLLASHPRTADRRKKLERVIPDFPTPRYEQHEEGEFLRVRQAVREYDDMYSRLMGVHLPGGDLKPPELSRRQPPNATP